MTTTLNSPMWRVPAGPDPVDDRTGVRWLRHHVARFTEGADHERLRGLAVDALAGVDVEALRRAAAEATAGPDPACTDPARTVPVAVLATALGLPVPPAGAVAAIAAAYQPDTGPEAPADDAVALLVGTFGGVADEPTAARIGLLVQAYAATAGLIGNAVASGRSVAGTERDDPPVRTTRRVDPATGAVVTVDLTGLPFGAGRHACPGAAHARAIAEGVLAALRGEVR